MNPAVVNNPVENSKKKPIAKIVKLGILTLALIAVAILGIRWYIQLTTTVTTDNAKVSADLVSISAEVTGKLTDVNVQEGDSVKIGQLLTKVDDSQYLINLQQAKGALDMANANYAKLPDDIESANANLQKAQTAVTAATAQVQSAQAQCQSTQAQYNSARITLADAERQLTNTKALYEAGSVAKESLHTAQSSFDKAQSGLAVAQAVSDAAQAGLISAQASLQSSQAGVTDAQAKLNALNSSQANIYKSQIESAQAAYNNAQLALARTTIKAPIDGNLVRLAALKGQNVSVGTSICTIVDPEQVWVLANIEEKKVERIQPGDKVDIVVDAYPNTVFNGQVEEISGATQSSFSILPTENASGNYTKVAQRISIKISVSQQDNKLKPGMSAGVTIKTNSAGK